MEELNSPRKSIEGTMTRQALTSLFGGMCRGKEEEEGEKAICSCQSCQTGSSDLNSNIFKLMLFESFMASF